LTRRHHGQHIPAEENSFHDFSLAMAKNYRSQIDGEAVAEDRGGRIRQKNET
jgi:hypothetical protein